MTLVNTPAWLLDSGASHHIISDLANLSMHSPYSGNDDVVIADGKRLQITHTGCSSIPSNTRDLTLSNVLRVPTVSRNLISVKRLCTDNGVSWNFFPIYFRWRISTRGHDCWWENRRITSMSGHVIHPHQPLLLPPPQKVLYRSGTPDSATLL